MTFEEDTLFKLENAPRFEGPRDIHLPESDLIQSRLLGVLENATKDELLEGEGWYFKAHSLCQKLASTKKGLDTTRTAAIIAALSPLTSWDENVRRAERLIKFGDVGGLGHAVITAKDILNGADPETRINRTRQNYKVSAFFHNIAFPSTSNDVTIDRHMWAMVFDDVAIMDKAQLYFKAKEYGTVKDEFRTVATGLELLPHQLQAITWLTWRRMVGKSPKAKLNPNQLSLDLE